MDTTIFACLDHLDVSNAPNQVTEIIRERGLQIVGEDFDREIDSIYWISQIDAFTLECVNGSESEEKKREEEWPHLGENEIKAGVVQQISVMQILTPTQLFSVTE